MAQKTVNLVGKRNTGEICVAVSLQPIFDDFDGQGSIDIGDQMGELGNAGLVLF